MRKKRTRLVAILLSVSMTLTLFCCNTLTVGAFAFEAAEETDSSALASETGEESSSSAAAETSSGTCGTNLKWSLDEAGVLKISGTGDMEDYTSANVIPWHDVQDSITKVVIESGVTKIGDMAFYGCGHVVDVSIPDTVTTIGDLAFEFCSSLEKIEIPKAVTSIAARAFDGCVSLQAINVAEGNPDYCSVDGVLFSADKTKLIQYPDGYPETKYIIPDTVTSIGQGAFADCCTLEYLTIPASVSSFAYGVLSECSKLTTAGPIGSGCNIEYGWESAIPSRAFYNCPLETVTIGDGIRSIGSDAFSWCQQLKDVYYNKDETAWKQISIGSGNSCLTKTATIHLKDGVEIAPEPIETPESMPSPEPLAEPVSVTEQGDGTAEHPYQIASVDDLLGIEDKPDACYILTKDITVSERNDIVLTGVFDGNHHTVTLEDKAAIGLFRLNKGTIKNLNLNVSAQLEISQEDCPIEDDIRWGRIGCVCSTNYGLIQDCTVKGNLQVDFCGSGSFGIGGSLAVGGIAGVHMPSPESSENTAGTIKRCWSALNISIDGRVWIVKGNGIEETGTRAENTLVGGIAGYCFGNIAKCLNTGNISMTLLEDDQINTSLWQSYCGGISGWTVYKGTITSCVQAGDKVKLKSWLIGHRIILPEVKYWLFACSFYDMQMGFISGGEYTVGTETPSLESSRVKNCSIWKDCGLRADLIRQPCDVSDSYTAYAEDTSYSMRSSKQIMDWWKGLKREDTGNPGEDISTISKTVRYFKKWDSEKQIAYFGEQDQNGSLVAEETDTSFLENLSDLEGHYVLAETRAREDEFIGPDTLLSIKPVETNVGTVTSANAERITIGNDAYSPPEWLLQPDSYEKKFVLYHIYEEKIVGIETLKTEKGTLTQWNADTRAVTIDPEGADKDACVYTLSTLADDETLTRLGETGQKQIVVHYIADSNHFLYRVKLLPVSISYSSDYVRETEDSITYTIQIEATNNNTEAALNDVFIKMGVGNDSVLLDDDSVQKKGSLAAGEKMTAEYTVRLDKKTYTDGSKYYFTVFAGAAGVETASKNGSVQVKYRNQKPDVWSIVNGGTYWGNRGYYITKNDYERLLSNLPATSRERFNFIIEFEAIKNKYGISQMKAVNCLNVDGKAEKGTYAKWGGSCYGMSAWVCLVARGIRSAADISKAAATLYESGGNDCKDEVTSAINFYQNQQCLTVCQNTNCDFGGKSQKEQIQCLEQLATAASSGGSLVDISVHWCERLKDGTIDTEKQKGHTVVGYGIETGDYTAYVRKMMGDSVQNTTFTHRILIYDCNCPDGDEACNIYYSDDDVWCIPYYGIVGADKEAADFSEYNNGVLGCVTADEEILNAIDYKTGQLSEKAKNAVPTGNMLDYSLESEFTLNWSGNTANVNGAIVSGNTGNERIYTSIAPNVTADGESTETTATAYLPDANSYTVTTKGDAVAFQFESSSYLNTVISSAPGTATFQTTGGATLKTTEEGMTYISITSNAGLNKLPWNTLAAIGDGATEIAMQPSEQGVLLSGDNLDGITILGRGKGEPKEVTFSTGEDAVMISQNEGELAILVDKDHDGVFETDITPAIANGTCGDQLTWMLDSVGTLSITGTGAMEIWGGSYSQKWGSTARAPWYSMRDQIKKVVVGEQVTSLSPYAFEGCANLNQVSLPDTLLVIGDYAFSECRKLNTLKLPEQLLSIGTGAFIGCKGLKELTIPSTVCYTGTSETAGVCTLEYCDTIYGYTNSGAYWHAEKWGIPFQSLGTLSQGDPGYIGGELIATGQKGTYVFWVLYGDGQLFYSGTGAMDETNVLNSGSAELLYEHGQEVKRAVFTEGITSVGASVLASNKSGSGEAEKFNALTSVEVADSVVEIEKRAFYDCPALQFVTIGAGVTAIGDYVFSYDNALSQIRVSSDNPSFKSENNILFSKDGRVLYRYPHNTDASYTIPKGTEVIAVDAFGDCTALTEITIPTSVTEIKSDAFDGCSSLTDVYYDGSKTDWNAVVIESNNGALTGATIHFSLPSEEIKSLTDCSVMLDRYSYTYDGKEKKPDVTVKDGSTTLTSGKDYDVTYADNIDAGTAKVTVTGKGSYSGFKTLNFEILKAYQTLSVRYSTNRVKVGKNITIEASAKTVVSYSSSDTNIAVVSDTGVVTGKAAGTATITITANASKNYDEISDTLQVIVTEPQAAKKISDCVVTLQSTSYTYDGGEKMPEVTVKDGSTTLTSGKDYEVIYANNTNAGTAIVTVTGKGNYTGTKTVNFTIEKAVNGITAANMTKVASEKTQSFNIGAKVKGGAKLTYKSNNKSITVDKNGKVTIAKNYIGKATITISAAATTNYNAAVKQIYVTVIPTGTKLSSVTSAKIGQLTIKWAKNAAVTGYQVQYAASSKFTGAKTLTVKSNKTVTSTLSKLKQKQKYYVRIRTYKTVGKVNYYSAWSAAKSATVKGVTAPAAVKLTSVKSAKAGEMTVKWGKNAKVGGYQLQYATASNFKGAKAVTIKKAATTSTTIKKLTKGKKYYVRVRTYQKVSGKTYYSAWSASKNVTIKK